MQRQLLVTLSLRALIWTCGTLTLPVQCLFCHRFGERSLSLIRIALATALIAFVQASPLTTMPNFELLTAKWFAHWNIQAIVVHTLLATIMLWHWVDIQARKANGERWHSRSCGLPWSWLGPDDKSQRLFVQPLLTLILGNLWFPFNTLLAGYFYAVAVCMFIGWFCTYNVLRGRLLDLIDQDIEARSLRSLVAQESAPNDGDILQHVVTPVERMNAPDLADIVAAYRATTTNSTHALP
jgi:hypothetical protein